MFPLGYLSVREPTPDAPLGVVVLLVLVSRESLQFFARETLRAGEVNAAVILLVFVFVWWRPARWLGPCSRAAARNADEPLQTQNPLDVNAALKLGLVIGVLLIAVASAQRAFGPRGAQWVAMLGGLFELQGVSLATAVLLREGHVALEAAGFAIALAILASFLSKFGILWFLGRRADFALRVSAGLAAMLAAGTGAWMLLRP